MTPSEPRNPFYLALLLVSLIFVMTVLAVAVVPVLEKKAADAGEPAPPSAWRDYLRTDGWQLLLFEGGAVLILGLLSMAIDRLRRLQKENTDGTIPPTSHPV